MTSILIIVALIVFCLIIYGIAFVLAHQKAESAQERAKQELAKERALRRRAQFDQRIGSVTSVFLRPKPDRTLAVPFEEFKKTSDVYRYLVTKIFYEKVPSKSKEISFYKGGRYCWYCDLISRESGGASFVFDDQYRDRNYKSPISLSGFVEVPIRPASGAALLQSIVSMINHGEETPASVMLTSGNIINRDSERSESSEPARKDSGTELHVVWVQGEGVKLPLLFDPPRLQRLMVEKVLERHNWEHVAAILYCHASKELVLEETLPRLVKEIKQIADVEVQDDEPADGLNKMDVVCDAAISLARDKYGILYAIASGVGAYMITGKIIFSNNLTIDVYRYADAELHAFRTNGRWAPRYSFLEQACWIITQTTIIDRFSSFGPLATELNRTLRPLVMEMKAARLGVCRT